MHIVEAKGILGTEQGQAILLEVQQAMADHADDVWVDCQEVTFMDSMGLGCLIQAFKHVRDCSHTLHLCRINSQLKTVLELTCADSVFSIQPERPSRG